jgi:hypothetical protein
MKKFSFIFLVLLSGCLPFEKPLPLEAHFERIVGQEEIYEKLEDISSVQLRTV